MRLTEATKGKKGNWLPYFVAKAQISVEWRNRVTNCIGGVLGICRVACGTQPLKADERKQNEAGPARTAT